MKEVRIHLQFKGIKAHNAIDKGERYDYSLRRILKVTKCEHDKLSDNIILRMSIKAINHMIVPNGLVPSILVF